MLPTWDILGHIGTYWDIFWQFLDDDMEPENDVTSPFYPKSRIRNENLRTFDSKTTAILYFVGFVISMCSSSPRLFFFNMWKSHKVSHRPLEIHGNPPEVRAARCLAALLSFLDFDAQKLSVWGEPRVHLGAGEKWWNSLVKLTCETNMRKQWCCLKWLLASGVSISRSSGWWSTIIIYNSPRWYLSGLQCIHYRTW